MQIAIDLSGSYMRLAGVNKKPPVGGSWLKLDSPSWCYPDSLPTVISSSIIRSVVTTIIRLREDSRVVSITLRVPLYRFLFSCYSYITLFPICQPCVICFYLFMQEHRSQVDFGPSLWHPRLPAITCPIRSVAHSANMLAVLIGRQISSWMQIHVGFRR